MIFLGAVFLLISGMHCVVAMEPEQKMVRISGSGEGEPFDVPMPVAQLSGTITQMLEGPSVGNEIKLEYFETSYLQKNFNLLEAYNAEKNTDKLLTKTREKIDEIRSDKLIETASTAEFLSVPPVVLSLFAKDIAKKKSLLSKEQKDNSAFVRKYVKPLLITSIINKIKQKILQEPNLEKSIPQVILIDVLVAQFMNNDKWVVLGGGRQTDGAGVFICDIADGKMKVLPDLILARGLLGKNIKALAVYENEATKYIAAGGNDQPDNLHIINISNIAQPRECICENDEKPVRYVAFNGDGTSLVAAHRNNCITVWDFNQINWTDNHPVLDQNQRRVLDLTDFIDKEGIFGMIIEEQTCYVLGKKEDKVLLLHININPKLPVISINRKENIIEGAREIHHAQFSPDGEQIAIMISQQSQSYDIVAIYDRSMRAIQYSWHIDRGYASGQMSFMDNKSLVMTQTSRIGLYMYDILADKPQHLLPETYIAHFCFNKDGSMIAAEWFMRSIRNERFLSLWKRFSAEDAKIFKKMEKIDLNQEELIERIVSHEKLDLTESEQQNWDKLDQNIKTFLRRICRIKEYLSQSDLYQIEENAEAKYSPLLYSGDDEIALPKDYEKNRQTQIYYKFIDRQPRQQQLQTQQQPWWWAKAAAMGTAALAASYALYQYLTHPQAVQPPAQ